MDWMQILWTAASVILLFMAAVVSVIFVIVAVAIQDEERMLEDAKKERVSRG